ncbi:hypothetical protein AVEN_168844-1 [Araneus ventricosus]|uniref:Uncharacterized protein n=1 Tax=Araneus ventricosus TaxID=182803 RepID=A0A4Y2JJG2_ARAVE|nr:hypothetical protein AVEN_98851-1 [Araneus ventricosus]GBM89579.1 hypothetical protein AVEN_168844-1 [Araneus ventricosus]
MGGPLRIYLTITSTIADASWIDTTFYCQIVRRLRRAIMTSGVVFVPGNVYPHSALLTQQLLDQFKWDVSDQQTWSPDLAMSDFHLFTELNNFLGSQSFQKK